MLRTATRLLAFVLLLGVVSPSPCPAQEALILPEGVTHVALPPGTLTMERIMKNGKPLLRLTVGKTVICGRTLFLGDGKHAMQFDATKEGILWARPGGKKGPVIDGTDTYAPGSTLGAKDGEYYKVGELKAGSVYLTTPSVKFKFSP
jgi:hypothetical protein